jgi:hypothetical protein
VAGAVDADGDGFDEEHAIVTLSAASNAAKTASGRRPHPLIT